MDNTLKFRNMTITAEDRTKTKKFDEDSFSFIIPTPAEKVTIINATSAMMQNRKIDSIGNNDYDYIRMIITLNSVLKDTPEWWKSAENCMSDSLLDEIWNWVLEEIEEFDRGLRKSTSGKDMGTT